MSEYDISRMRDVVKFVREHRENSDQRVWSHVPDPDDSRLDIQDERVPRIRAERCSRYDCVNEVDDLVPVRTIHASVDELLECGTTACFAGWTVILNGDTLLTPTSLRDTDDNRQEVNYCRIKGESTITSIERRAKELLGLNTREASSVFEDTTNIEEVADVLSYITGVKI